jgi:hypothetical protein
MKLTTSHYVMFACTLAAAGVEVAEKYVATGNHLPFHLTAAAALTLLTTLGAVSKSALADKDAPATQVTSDVLRAVASSLDKSDATTMHMAILDAVKQNVLTTPAGK